MSPADGTLVRSMQLNGLTDSVWQCRVGRQRTYSTYICGSMVHRGEIRHLQRQARLYFNSSGWPRNSCEAITVIGFKRENFESSSCLRRYRRLLAVQVDHRPSLRVKDLLNHRRPIQIEQRPGVGRYLWGVWCLANWNGGWMCWYSEPVLHLLCILRKCW